MLNTETNVLEGQVFQTPAEARQALINNLVVNQFIRNQMDMLESVTDPMEELASRQSDIKELFVDLYDFSGRKITDLLTSLELLFTSWLSLHPKEMKEYLAMYSMLVKLINTIVYNRELIEEELTYHMHTDAALSATDLANL